MTSNQDINFMELEERRICSWTASQTKFLLDRFKMYIDDVEKRKIKSKRIMWEMISADFHKSGTNFSSVQCENRWKTLLRHYRRRSSKYKNTNSRLKPFHEDLTEILQNSPNLPVTHELKCATSDDENHEEKIIIESDESDFEDKCVTNRIPMEIIDDDDDDDSLQEIENNFDEEKEYVETTKEFMNNIQGQHQIPIDHNNLQTLPSALLIDDEKSNAINADIAKTLRKFTTELLKNEKQKLTLRQKKLQLMAERNDIIKSIKPTVSPLMPNSPVHIPKYDGIMQFSNNPSPAGIGNVNSSNTTNFKQIEQNLVSPQQVDMEEYVKSAPITKDSTTAQVAQWLTYHRLNSYVGTFTHFSGSDILRMSKEDLIQICGLADGIRMFNTLHAKAITPRLTIYVSLDGNSYNAVYLISNTIKELTQKLFKLPGFYELCANNNANVSGVDGNSFSGWGLNSKYSGSGSNLYDASKLSVYVNGPNGIQVLVTDEVLNNIKDDSLFTIEFQNNGKILMKASYNNKNESN